jgi:hypothetical protein
MVATSDELVFDVCIQHRATVRSLLRQSFSEGILVGFPVRRHKRFVDLLNANAQPMINSDAWEASREPKIPCFGSRLRRYEARY